MTLDKKLILNLPDAPDFISEPPKYTVSEMIQICEAMLPYWNKIRYSQPPPVNICDEFILKKDPFQKNTTEE